MLEIERVLLKIEGAFHKIKGEQKVLLLRKIDALAAFENLAATAESRWKLLSRTKTTDFFMFGGKL